MQTLSNILVTILEFLRAIVDAGILLWLAILALGALFIAYVWVRVGLDDLKQQWSDSPSFKAKTKAVLLHVVTMLSPIWITVLLLAYSLAIIWAAWYFLGVDCLT